MKVLWLLIGVVLGVAGAGAAARTDRGRRVLEQVDGSASEFLGAVADSYRARRAELAEGS